MALRHQQPFPGVLFACMFLIGCTGAERIALKDREIKELRYEKDRLCSFLNHAIDAVEQLRQQIEAVDEEKITALSEIEGLEDRLRFANEKLELAERGRQKLKTDLGDSEAQSAMLERSLRKVQNVASSSVEELVELRLKSGEFDQKVENLEKENESLRDDRRRLVEKVETLQDELIKSKAVVRSFRSSTLGEKDAIIALEGNIEKLERENADLRSSNVALEKRIENLLERKQESSQALAKNRREESPEEELVEARQGLVYQSDPAGLGAEFLGLAASRYRDALTGNIRWDTFDRTAVGFAGVVFMCIVWTILRSRRTRRLRREIDDLHEELVELESQEEALYDQPIEQRPARTRSPGLSHVAGGSSAGFSAVISSKSVANEVPPEVDETEDAPTMVMYPVEPSAPLEPVAGEPRKVLGVRAWDESADDEPIGGEATQVISHVSQQELLSNELVIPGSAGGVSKQQEQSSGAKSPELLAELKAVINKKFDEIVN